jgi:hypothetical protein
LTVQIIAPQSMVKFAMSNDWLNSTTSSDTKLQSNVVEYESRYLKKK